MTFSKSREYTAARCKADGVFRVLMVGDSMAYGHGVPWRRTLPSALEGFLNGTVWDRRIEVINGGISGLGLLEMWSALESRGQAYAPDVAVLVLCENDAMLDLSSDLYMERVEQSWQPDGAAFGYFREAFAGFVDQAAQFDLPLAVAFYQVGPTELREPALSSIEACCEQYRVPLVDLSQDFQAGSSDPGSPTPVSTEPDPAEPDPAEPDPAEPDPTDPEAWRRWVIGSFNAHPTAVAHQLAGRRLGRFLAEAGLLPADAAKREADVLAKLGEQSAAAVRAGKVASWEAASLLELWQRKKGCPGRLRLPREQRLTSSEFRRGRELLRTVAAAATEQLSWQGLQAIIELEQRHWRRRLDDLNEEVYRLLRKDLFIVECNVGSDRPRFDIEARSGRSHASLDRLAPLASSIERRLAILKLAT